MATIIQQGAFTSAGTAVNLPIASGVDWIETYNQTAIAAQLANAGAIFKCQFINGAPIGTGWQTLYNGASTAVNLAVAPALSFSLVDTSVVTQGPPVVLTSISAAGVPIVATGTTTGLANGSVVRLVNVTGVQQFGGMTFSIDTIVPSTSFRLAFAPQIAAGTGGFYRIVPYDPIFFPRNRFITAITTGTTTQVKMSVLTTYTVGQEVRLTVPPAYGSISQNINGLQAGIIAVNLTTNVVTLDLNSTGFGTFVFPLTAATPFTPAQIAPVGAELPGPVTDPSNLSDATDNSAYIGVRLAPGLNGPAGQAADVVAWIAGTSDVTNGNAFGAVPF
jgi:hypothetical protein